MTWTAPFLIPSPAFGINEVLPALPDWSSARTGFYLVNESSPAATDVNNPFGYGGHPRRTIPQLLPSNAKAVVVLGKYTTRHTSPYGIVAQGAADNPIFITGYQGMNSELAAPVEVQGRYAIFENLKASSIVFRDPIDHVVLRDAEVVGGGVGVVKWGTGAVSDVVVLRTKIHDCGDMNAAGDPDNHGITVNACNRFWALDNTIYRCAGDGTQVEAGSFDKIGNCTDIYLGRNTCYDNRQEGLWCKHARNVWMVENECYGHQPSAGSGTPGPQLGAQYAPDGLWILKNKLHDGNLGIYLASFNDGFVGRTVLYQNEIYNVRGAGDVRNPWMDGAAFRMSCSGGLYARENNLHDCDGGFYMPAGLSYVHLEANVVTRMARAAVNLEGSPQFELVGNHFDDPSGWVLHGQVTSVPASVANR